MWVWIDAKRLVNLAQCSRLELRATTRGQTSVVARTPDALETLQIFDTEEDARAAIQRLRIQLNRAQKG